MRYLPTATIVMSVSQRVSRSVHFLTRSGTRRRINCDLTHLLRRRVRNWQAAFVTPLAHLCFGLFGLLRIQSAIASEIQGLRWKRESGSALIHNIHDPQEYIFADAKKIRPVPGLHIGEQFNIQGGSAETDKSNA